MGAEMTSSGRRFDSRRLDYSSMVRAGIVSTEETNRVFQRGRGQVHVHLGPSPPPRLSFAHASTDEHVPHRSRTSIQ